jgi:hypothetical protein
MERSASSRVMVPLRAEGQEAVEDDLLHRLASLATAPGLPAIAEQAILRLEGTFALEPPQNVLETNPSFRRPLPQSDKLDCRYGVRLKFGSPDLLSRLWELCCLAGPGAGLR